MKKHVFNLNLLVFALSQNLYAVDLKRDSQEVSLESPEVQQELETDMLFLLVDKKELRADLMTWPKEIGQSETLMSFRIAIGKEEGDKLVEGDNRTPEGIYFAQEIIDGKTLPAKYGPFAIPINFPNPYDVKLGKTGYGIWLHGVEADARIEEAKVTEGCVAFYNSDIQALVNWLKPFQSIIVIANSSEDVNRIEDVRQLDQLTREWAHYWQARDSDKYLEFYDTEFRFNGMNRAEFSEYKKRVFESYKSMFVNIFNVRTFAHKSYAISVFNQDFNGDDRYISNGRKVLYWKKQDDGKWRITHEIFESKRFELQSYSKDLLVRLSRESPSAKQFVKELKSSM